MSDEYLWDKSGAPDPEVEHLEELLGELRFDREPPAVPEHQGRPELRLLVAAAVLIAVGALTFLLSPGRDRGEESAGPGWAYQLSLEGAPTSSQGELAVGQWLETGAFGKARLTVADIGSLELQPRSRLQLLASGTDQHRVRLEQGAMHVKVNAPPRLFITETPVGDAVDLGCEYTLEVDPDGDGMLDVTLGMVMFERGGYDAFVPAGARCVAKRDRGMGTPHFTSASPVLRRALERLDFAEDGPTALGEVIEECKARDTLTLWNLLQHPRLDRAARERVLDRILDYLTELPVELNRADLTGGNAESLERLRDRLWLRFW